MLRHEVFKSNYLRKEDVGDELTVSITEVASESVQSPSGSIEKKRLIYLDGHQPLILNATNWDAIAELYGPDDKGWVGHRITLYNDQSVVYAGKKAGGIRVRPKKPAAKLADDVPSEITDEHLR